MKTKSKRVVFTTKDDGNLPYGLQGTIVYDGEVRVDFGKKYGIWTVQDYELKVAMKVSKRKKK